jgi:hypothetical protein
MSVSCGLCDYDDCEWWYIADRDYSVLQTKRRKRCASCHDLIDIGSTVLKMENEREPRTEVEQRIYNDNHVPLADSYFCETCADLYFSIVEAGYCVTMEKGVSLQAMLRDIINEQ